MSEMSPNVSTKLKHKKSRKPSCRPADAIESSLTPQPCPNATHVPYDHNSILLSCLCLVLLSPPGKQRYSYTNEMEGTSTWAVEYNWTLKPKKDNQHFKEDEQNHLISAVFFVCIACAHSLTILSESKWNSNNLLEDDWFWSGNVQHDKLRQCKSNCFLI